MKLKILYNTDISTFCINCTNHKNVTDNIKYIFASFLNISNM